MTSLDDYRKITDNAAPLMRMIGDCLIVVHQTDFGISAAWGFTIWRQRDCLAGARNWNWGAEDAAREALATLARIRPDLPLLPEGSGAGPIS